MNERARARTDGGLLGGSARALSHTQAATPNVFGRGVADSVRGGIVRNLAEAHRQQTIDAWATSFSPEENEYSVLHADPQVRLRWIGGRILPPIVGALLKSSKLGAGYVKVCRPRPNTARQCDVA